MFHRYPCWFGKLPSLGDFASRRMPIELLEPWDDWLSAGMVHCMTAHPTDWLERYLGSPSWRFIIMPQVVGSSKIPMAGAMIPSVDKVGRYFPFTVLRFLDGLPVTREGWHQLMSWLYRLDAVAVDAMREDWSVERLDAALLAGDVTVPLDLMRQDVCQATLDVGDCFEVLGDMGNWVAEQASYKTQDYESRQSWWWCDGINSVTHLKVVNGLPLGDAFLSLLNISGRL